jgi:tetratricopeptide (TPR) repeat protein
MLKNLTFNADINIKTAIMKKIQDDDSKIFERFQINLYEAALRSNPNNIEALKSLGYIYSQEGNHKKALEIDKRLVRLLPEEAVIHYNLACSYAQLNHLEETFSELEMAILLGYSDWKHMEQDKDLANMKKDPRYKQLLDSLKKKYAT